MLFSRPDRMYLCPASGLALESLGQPDSHRRDARRATLAQALGRHHGIARKLAWHSTPEHGAWLKMAECELSVLERQCLAHRIPEVGTLKRDVAAWEQRRNQGHVTSAWRFTAAAARIKGRRLRSTG